MTEQEPLWLFFGEQAQVSLRRLADGITVYFEVIATGDVPALVLTGNTHIGSCDMTITPDGLGLLGLGLCVVPIVNDLDTVYAVAHHLGIPPPVANPAHAPSRQRLFA